jgi:serine/threonine-protein kinase RIO1
MNLFPELSEDLSDVERRQEGVQRRIKQEQDSRNRERSRADYERRNLLLEKIKGKRKPDPVLVTEINLLNERIAEGRQIQDPDLVKAGAKAQLVYYREVVKFLEGIVNG